MPAGAPITYSTADERATVARRQRVLEADGLAQRRVHALAGNLLGPEGVLEPIADEPRHDVEQRPADGGLCDEHGDVRCQRDVRAGGRGVEGREGRHGPLAHVGSGREQGIGARVARRDLSTPVRVAEGVGVRLLPSRGHRQAGAGGGECPRARSRKGLLPASSGAALGVVVVAGRWAGARASGEGEGEGEGAAEGEGTAHPEVMTAASARTTGAITRGRRPIRRRTPMAMGGL